MFPLEDFEFCLSLCNVSLAKFYELTRKEQDDIKMTYLASRKTRPYLLKEPLLSLYEGNTRIIFCRWLYKSKYYNKIKREP